MEAFLSWLSNELGVLVSTHRQALSAVLFLYEQVLGQQLPWMAAIGRPLRKPRLPVVLSATEVPAVLGRLDSVDCGVAWLLYGTGMCIAEPLRRVRERQAAGVQLQAAWLLPLVLLLHGLSLVLARRC